MTRRAPFIVIEGLDRSGKTTQTSLLHSHLTSLNIPVKLLKFPDRTTPIGKMIDSYLRSQSDLDDHAIHLLFSANRWELASTITSLLTSGTLVLCDRYAFSGIAFSASKPSLQRTFPSGKSSSSNMSSASRGSGGSADDHDGSNDNSGANDDGDALPWCRAPDISLPAPDLTIFLDVTPSQAKLRGGYGEERYEKEEMQGRVRQVFLRLGSEMTSVAVKDGEEDNTKRYSQWVVIDAGGDRETVAEELWKLVEPLTKGIDGEIKRLWEDKLIP